MKKFATAAEAKEDWWDKGEIADEHKEIYHTVLEDYLDSFDQDPCEIKEKVSLCKAIIPSVGTKVKHWEGF